MSRITTRAVLAATGLLALSVTAAGCGGNSASATKAPATTATAKTAAVPATPGPVKVLLSEWKVEASATTAKAGNVTFAVTNTGSITHELIVIRTDKGAADLGKSSRVPETGSAGETGDVAVSKTKSVTLKLAPGKYALICNIAGHYVSGMRTDFKVG